MRIVCELDELVGRRTDKHAVAIVETELPSHLSELELTVTSDYYSSFRRPAAPTQVVLAEDYLYGCVDRWPDHSLLCAEMPVSRRFTQFVHLRVTAANSWSKNAVAVLHAGRPGCMAPVHFDWDHCWVAHACLTGRKRFFLFPPEAGWLLCPVINTSALAVPRFTTSDRMEFLKRVGGSEIVLEAGQGILFPSMFWHGVLYEEPCLSVSVRFETMLGGRPFAALPRSTWLQRIVWLFFKQGYGDPANELLSDYLQVFFKRAGWKERYRRVMALCRQKLLENGERQGAAELTGENFSAEMVLAAKELAFYYGNVQNPIQSDERHNVQETLDYIFEGIPHRPATSTKLAAYATKVRQGLPPKRGLVEIVCE
jgi:hypothetical protein